MTEYRIALRRGHLIEVVTVVAPSIWTAELRAVAQYGGTVVPTTWKQLFAELIK